MGKKARNLLHKKRTAAFGVPRHKAKGRIDPEVFRKEYNSVEKTVDEWKDIDEGGWWAKFRKKSLADAQQADAFFSTADGQLWHLINTGGQVLQALGLDVQVNGEMSKHNPFNTLAAKKADNNAAIPKVVIKEKTDTTAEVVLGKQVDNADGTIKGAAGKIQTTMAELQDQREEVYKKQYNIIKHEMLELHEKLLDKKRSPPYPIDSVIAAAKKSYARALKRVNSQLARELDAIDQIDDNTITDAGGDPAQTKANLKKQIKEQYNRDIQAIIAAEKQTVERLQLALSEENLAKYYILAGQSKETLDDAVSKQHTPDSSASGKILADGVRITGLDISKIEYLRTPTGNIIQNDGEGGAWVRWPADAKGADKQRDITYLVTLAKAQGLKTIDLTVNPPGDEKLTNMCIFSAIKGGYKGKFTINGKPPTVDQQAKVQNQLAKALDLRFTKEECEEATRKLSAEMKNTKMGTPIQQPQPPAHTQQVKIVP